MISIASAGWLRDMVVSRKEGSIPALWCLTFQRSLESGPLTPGYIRKSGLFPPGDWSATKKVPSPLSPVFWKVILEAWRYQLYLQSSTMKHGHIDTTFLTPPTPKTHTRISFNLWVDSSQQELEGSRSKRHVIRLPSPQNSYTRWLEFLIYI